MCAKSSPIRPKDNTDVLVCDPPIKYTFDNEKFKHHTYISTDLHSCKKPRDLAPNQQPKACCYKAS